jgi:hypothetical protein
MANGIKLKLPPPDGWEVFEDLCWGLWKSIWKCDSAKKHGRVGQPQNGVDIYGRPNNGKKWAGVQCKGKDENLGSKLKELEIENEAKKAKSFSPTLSEYIIATTSPRDTKLQKKSREMTEAHLDEGIFSVDVCAWEDIVDLLFEYAPPVAKIIYPTVFGGELASVGGKILKCLSNHLYGDAEMSGMHFEEKNENNKSDPFERKVKMDDDISGILAHRALPEMLTLLKSIHEELKMDNRGSVSSSDRKLEDAVQTAMLKRNPHISNNGGET